MAEPISPANLTHADRQKLRNLFQGGLQAVDSPTTARETEHSILLALVHRAEAILEGGTADGA
jgi:hypothetical protein